MCFWGLQIPSSIAEQSHLLMPTLLIAVPWVDIKYKFVLVKGSFFYAIPYYTLHIIMGPAILSSGSRLGLVAALQ